MKNFAILSLLFFVSGNMAAMQRDKLVEFLRSQPTGSGIIVHGELWTVEENTLSVNRTGKVVLLNTVQACGKVVHEYRQTIEIRPSQTNPGLLTFTNIPANNITRWGIFIASSWLVGVAALLGVAIS